MLLQWSLPACISSFPVSFFYKMLISTAGIILKDNKFLLALRNPGTSIGESWEFPGGKAEESETPREALTREYKEEFNVEIKVGKRICSGTFTNRDREFEIFGYLVNLVSEELTLREHSRTGWFSLKEMTDLQMAGSDKQIVETLKCLYPPE